jgi:hypothetical protein
MFSLPFLLPAFAIAGLAAAAGPVIIHLLNRRRFRIIQWAAMDFLREAIFRSRRILQIRDLLLMALRMLCLVLFGAALARPYLTQSAAMLAGPDQPVHAVVLVDNSLSMGYETREGTLLDQAKAKARETIERLPPGSRITVLPTCGSPAGMTADAYSSPEEATAAVGNIRVVDRATRPASTIDLALDACRRLPTMTAKQIFLVTDQHVANWPGESLVEHLKQLPAPMQIIEVAAESYDNAWIEDFRLRDGMADVDTPGVFVATIRYRGPQARRDVQVTLTIDGVAVAAQTVDLQSGQKREVQFPPYKFDVTAEPGKPATVLAQVSIPSDALPADDQRFLVVPVVAAVPAVFVDQYGPEEDPRQNRHGDTYWLRRLVAPLTRQTAAEHQLIQVRHVKINQLSRELLADARLVVIAGVADPKGTIPLLKEYVEQGGNLVLATGGQFDPTAWTQAAWQDGGGILPAPLEPTPVGQLPSEAVGELRPLVLDVDTLVHQYFWPEGASEQEIKDSLGPQCLFFKAMVADVDDKTREQAIRTVAEQLRTEREGLVEIDRKLTELSQREAKLHPADAAQRDECRRQRTELEQRRATIRPNWLLWRPQREEENVEEPVERSAERTAPVVLGRFRDNNLPFMVRRRLGSGQVLLLTTGVSPAWTNMLTLSTRDGGPAWVFDHIFRLMLAETLPRRTLKTDQQIVLPVPAGEHTGRFALIDPEGQEQPLAVDALGGDRYGIRLADWTRRGIYRVTAGAAKEDSPEGPAPRRWEVALAVNGPADESDLVVAREADARPKSNQPTFLDATQASSVTLAQLEGKDLWKWALAAALACLLAELALLAWSHSGGERTT